MDFRVTIFWVLILSVSLASASELIYDTKINQSYIDTVDGNVSYIYEYTCPVCVNSTNTTNLSQSLVLPYQQNVTCEFNKTLQGNVTLTPNGTVLYGDGFSILLDNVNTTQTIAVNNITQDYVMVRFWSDYIVPETLKLSMYGRNYSFDVVGNTELHIPIEIDFENYNWTELVNETINMTMDYDVVGKNFSGVLSFPFRYDEVPKVTLVKEPVQYKVNDLIIEKMIIESKTPIKNVTINMSKKAETRVIIGQDEVYTYITPQETGDYHINYDVIDYFGNNKTIKSKITVQPLSTVFFNSLTIPSIKVGERSKQLIYDTDVIVPINYTLTDISFIPENVTLMRQKNITNDTAFEVYLSDGADNSYFTELNRTITIRRNTHYINFMPLVYGNLSVSYKVETPEEMQSNDEFTIRATVGDSSVFAEQKFDVGGVTVYCELTKPNDLLESDRKCWVEYPLNDMNLDNNMILLQERDYLRYERSHKNELQYLEDQKDDTIRNRENWLMVFVLGSFVMLMVLIYVILPKDWVVLRIKK